MHHAAINTSALNLHQFTTESNPLHIFNSCLSNIFLRCYDMIMWPIYTLNGDSQLSTEH